MITGFPRYPMHQPGSANSPTHCNCVGCAPASDVKDYFKKYAVFKQLPDLNNRLRELEKKVSAVRVEG